MKRVIVSGYFNPLHGGHLDMIESAAQLGDKLLVIVNNDKQQKVKKGKIILSEENRERLLNAIKGVDEVRIAIDEDQTVIESLRKIADDYPNDELIFANGGDRNEPKDVPEKNICQEKNIKMVYGVGGIKKYDSSTRINQALGHDK